MNKIEFMLVIVIISTSVITVSSVYAQDFEKAPILFNQAKEHFSNGEYTNAIKIYDDILEIAPNHIASMKMKGIALSNSGQHQNSLKQFYKILQTDPNDVLALAGMGVGFGNLGEYQESQRYFERALEIKPDNQVLQNYKIITDDIIKKYPYTPTEKPQGLVKVEITKIPGWIKSVAKWWSQDQIEDSEFVNTLRFLVANKIMEIPSVETGTKTSESIPFWIRDTAGWWADDLISDKDFVSGIHYMIENGILVVDINQDSDKIREENEKDFEKFEWYLRQINSNIIKEKRYIEFPNPSPDVIKKFLRDYVKWNFEEEVKSAVGHFPDPKFDLVDDVYVIHYIVYVNEQPSGLPLDHVNTFNDSLKFWEAQELTLDDNKVKFDFSYTGQRNNANVWVTWVVRDLGEGVLGHAHLGKGVVEVALGDYSCDGSFQLYNVESVKQIMTHELGHSLGLQHDSDPNNIMYPKFKPGYAYCLIG